MEDFETQELTVELKILRDSDDTYPQDQLKFSIISDVVCITIGNREICVSRDGFESVYKFLAVTQ